MSLRKAALALFVLLAACILMFTAAQRWMIFPRHTRTAPNPPVSMPEGTERWWLDLPDGREGRVEAWFAAGSGRSADNPGPAVIFAHGNAELIDDWPVILQWYRDRGISALMVEYRGYGRSDGSPSSEGIGRDFGAFRRRLIDRPEVDPDRLIYHGRSLGGGAVCNLADTAPPAAFVLHSTFSRLSDLAWEQFMVPSFMIRDEFDNLATLKATDRPVLLVHGARDQIVPIEHARRLNEAAADSRLVELEDFGHNDCPMRWGAVEQFLEKHALLE